MATDFAARLERFKSLTYPELFPAQAHVLARYASSYAEARDVAIELPTGVGKTLIALLIADLALDRGWSVAYLTGSNAPPIPAMSTRSMRRSITRRCATASSYRSRDC